MKKVLVSLVAMLCSVSGFAQYSSGGFSLDEENMYWGVRFGMTVSSLSGDLSSNLDLGPKVGMTLAGIVGLRPSDSTPVFIESGLYYTERGAKKDKIRVGYNTLEIPLVVKYGFKATDNIALLPFFGPYFSYAFSGKTKQYDGTSSNIVSVGSFDEKKAVTGGLKRANMGFKFGVGAEFNKLYLEIAYQVGITNICKAEAYSSHSNAFVANFGVNF